MALANSIHAFFLHAQYSLSGPPGNSCTRPRIQFSEWRKIRHWCHELAPARDILLQPASDPAMPQGLRIVLAKGSADG